MQKKGDELTQPHDHKTSATTNKYFMDKKFHLKKWIIVKTTTVIDLNDVIANIQGAYSHSL